jgi:SAM-dependent methyltransferase
LQIREAAFAIRRSIISRGVIRTFFHFARRAASSGRVRSPLARQAHPFDIEHGVETSGLIGGRELVSGHAHDADSTAYYGIAPSILRSALAQWTEKVTSEALDPRQFVFVDLGAGKGRAILLASEYPFRQVIGVELNRELAEIAQRNAQHWQGLGRTRCEIQVVNQDATEFPWPPAPLLVFLFNPFGRRVMAKVLQTLKEQAGRSGQTVDVLYVNPEFAFVLDRVPGLRKLSSRRIEMTSADKAVDVFSSASELCNLYRFDPHGK